MDQARGLTRSALVTMNICARGRDDRQGLSAFEIKKRNKTATY